MNKRNDWSLALLVIPFLALLYPPLYAHAEPRLSGIPFFIWYQFLWVILGAAIIYLVYVLRRTPEDMAATTAPAPGTPAEPIPGGTSEAAR